MRRVFTIDGASAGAKVECGSALMKVVVATSETQEQRRNDFHFATEGEIVLPAEPHDDEPVDGPCGCQRAFDGIASGKSTTTAKVLDLARRRAEVFG